MGDARAPRLRFRGAGSGVLLLLLIGAAIGCGHESRVAAAAITGGDPERGRTALRRYGCHACHTIPGVPGARGLVGPPLTQMGSRTYVRHLPNTPENLIRWIRHPKEVHEHTPMPDTGVTEADARDIVAYLYSLQ